jgi:hypothetical protein
MKINRISQGFAALAAIAGAAVLVLESEYWFSHVHRPGPAPHIALCGAGILSLAIAQLIRRG